MKLTKLLLLILIATSVNAQVKFERISFDEACKQASTSGKIIFAQFVSSTCEQCNEVADKAFTNKELGNAVKEKCIAIKIDLDNPDRNSFIEKYNPNETIGTSFITADGDLLYRMSSTTSWGPTYISEIEKAYNQFTEGRLPLKELDNLWNLSNNDFAAIEMNLRRRTELNLAVDSLLDVYVAKLPADSLASIRTLQFIAKQAPIINSSASTVLRKNMELFNQAWYAMSLQERVSINNRIIYKSRKKAVKNKNEKYAYSVAAFAYQTQTSSKELARKSFDYQFMEYYKDIKDTLNALPLIIKYIDDYFLKLPIDSIKQKDAELTKQRDNNIKADTIRKTATEYTVTRKRTSFSVMAKAYMPLNDAAWFIYQNTSNPFYIAKALAYTERYLQIYESPDVMDTYSRLLYQTGHVADAIKWQEKIIKHFTEKDFTAERQKNLLQKMKDGVEIK